MSKTDPDKFPLLSYIDELVEELRKDVPRAMKHWDAEAIHQARVATRRLKAALDLLKPVLSDEHLKPFSKVLKKLRRRLGPMRDLDVMIEHLGELRSKSQTQAIEWLKARLIHQRGQAREESTAKGAPARVLSRLGTWWGLREEVEEAREAADSLLAESLHAQLDSFAEQADRLAGGLSGSNAHVGAARQDPHAVRIAGKSFRYTLEMAAVQGHKLPAGIMGSFKRMQEALGTWHDYVVLTERAMQMSLQELLPHHDAEMQTRVLELARLLLRRSSHHLNQFSTLWLKSGAEVARAVRLTFPLTRSLIESKTDPDPPRSDESPRPAASPPDVLSNAGG
jgi:CHAD domain-containing protein